ncbi:MAG: hypothetical protein Q7U54_01465, partial [Bacteroidales bacterium]|nr:hypothetical protein [Bacteroidales bacterium]
AIISFPVGENILLATLVRALRLVLMAISPDQNKFFCEKNLSGLHKAKKAPYGNPEASLTYV